MKCFSYERKGETFVLVPEPVNEFERDALTSGDALEPEFVLRHRPFNRWRYNMYRLLNISGVDHYVYVRQLVDMAKVLKYTRESTPRCLYRIFSGEESENNGPNGFESFAAAGLRAQEMSVYSEEAISDNLKGHVQKSRDGCSHFISFKCSWMWAIHRALRLQEKLRHKQKEAQQKLRGNEDLSQEDDEALTEHFTKVHIAIIDTCNLRSPTVFFNAYAMLRAYNLERPYLKNKSHGEILVWDEIKGPFCVVSLDLLRNHQPDARRGGSLLLHLQPFLRRDPDRHRMQLRRRSARGKKGPVIDTTYSKPYQIRPKTYNVQKQRDEYKDALNMVGRLRTHKIEHTATAVHAGTGNHKWYAKDDRWPINEDQLSEFVTFVMIRFPTDLHFPMLINLLSGRLRYMEGQSIIEKMVDMLSDAKMVKDYVLYETGAMHHTLPELKAFNELLQSCCEALEIKVCRKGEAQPKRRFKSTTYGHSDLPNISDMTKLGVSVRDSRK